MTKTLRFYSTLISTQLQLGVRGDVVGTTASAVCPRRQTAEAVTRTYGSRITQLKLGANESGIKAKSFSHETLL